MYIFLLFFVWINFGGGWLMWRDIEYPHVFKKSSVKDLGYLLLFFLLGPFSYLYKGPFKNL